MTLSKAIAQAAPLKLQRWIEQNRARFLLALGVGILHAAAHDHIKRYGKPSLVQHGFISLYADALRRLDTEEKQEQVYGQGFRPPRQVGLDPEAANALRAGPRHHQIGEAIAEQIVINAGAMPAWAMTFAEFERRPSGVLLPGLKSVRLEDVERNPDAEREEREAEDAERDARERLKKAKHEWLLESWAASRLPTSKAGERAWGAYQKARDQLWAVRKKWRSEGQRRLWQAAVRLALRDGLLVPDHVRREAER